MANKKSVLTRRQKKTDILGFPKANAYEIGTAMRSILDQMERNKGLIKINNIASYDGKGINISSLISCLHILADPTHRENRWSCLVEMVKYDDEVYLRLVPSIPLEVKERWEATGTPPRQMASNDVQLMIAEILGKPGRSIGDDGAAKNGADNPYSPTHKLHAVFDMASEWITPSELFDKILKLPNVNRKYASALLHNIGSPARNGNRSRKAEKDGGKLIRAVRIG